MEVEDRVDKVKSLFFSGRIQEVLKSIFSFLLSLVIGINGFITIVFSCFLVFRHGEWLADLSFVELVYFIWLAYCFYKVKTLAKDHQYNFIFAYCHLFFVTGRVMTVTTLAYIAWFKWGAENGFKENFFASNLFEISLMLVVGVGCGLSVVLNKKFEEVEQDEAHETGDKI